MAAVLQLVCDTIANALDRRRKVMEVKLNKSAFFCAQELIHAGKVVLDERDAWSEHQPSAAMPGGTGLAVRGSTPVRG